MAIPDFNPEGDLPEGVHCATMEEVLARFGGGTLQRQDVTARLQRIYRLVGTTGRLTRGYQSYLLCQMPANYIEANAPVNIGLSDITVCAEGACNKSREW